MSGWPLLMLVLGLASIVNALVVWIKHCTDDEFHRIYMSRPRRAPGWRWFLPQPADEQLHAYCWPECGHPIRKGRDNL